MMLPARNRAPRALFTMLRARDRDTKKFEGAEFEIFFRKGSYPAKVGIVVSKRTAKKAVLRNRIKRTVAEAIKDELDQISGQLLIVVKSDISMLKTDDVKKKILEDLEKLND